MNAHLAHLRHQLADPLPHPETAELTAWLRTTADWVVQHFQTLPEQSIGRMASRADMESLLREMPPELGQDFYAVLTEFQERVVPFAFRVNHPRFLAFVPGAPTFPAIVGDLLCAGTNFFAGVWLEAAGPAQVELVVLDWFKQFLGYPPTAAGLLTGGGSEANLLALVTARERLTWAERERSVLYVSEQRHWSVDRAAKIMGLRPDQLRPLPTTAQLTLDPQTLLQCVAQDRTAGRHPWAVVANAGTTNTGAVDPLALLADVCQQERLWLHVDAAYGWPAVLLPAGQVLLAGIERAASITLDPHKWFGQTFEAGCLLVRDGRQLTETFALRPAYMQDVEAAEDEVNFADRGLALTRRFRALKIWLSVKVLGVAWFRALAERCCQLAELAELLLAVGPFQILFARQLSIVCFRFVPPGWQTAAGEAALDRLNLTLVEELRKTGRAFVSSTLLHDRVALRFCFVNWRTTAADVEETVQLLAELGRQLAARPSR